MSDHLYNTQTHIKCVLVCLHIQETQQQIDTVSQEIINLSTCQYKNLNVEDQIRKTGLNLGHSFISFVIHKFPFNWTFQKKNWLFSSKFTYLLSTELFMFLCYVYVVFRGKKCCFPMDFSSDLYRITKTRL